MTHTIRMPLLVLFFIVQLFSLQAQQRHTFAIQDAAFVFDGKPIHIHSGEMHYSRIPEAYWRHRIQLAKAMGLNTIATYCFWNFHNTSPGVWDFSSERHNLAKFFEICQEENMHVILRPGPYVCAEWEFGGYPWWLQNNPDLVIRNNKPFLDSCEVYIQHLANEVKDLQITHGGPIIMVQVENEFGSFVAQMPDIPREEHHAYNLAIKNMLLKAGFDVPLFTSDGDWLFENAALEGVFPTANGEHNVDTLKKRVNKYFPGGPYMVAEYYPGWLDHWGEPFNKVSAQNTVDQIEQYLKNDVSFNFYMLHGGTNFAFTSGANYTGSIGIQPDLTSYDYDAPISENGGVTLKYLALRELLSLYNQKELPAIPAPISVIELDDIVLDKKGDFLDWAKSTKPITNDQPLSFEQLNQGFGYVLYRRYFSDPAKGVIEVKGLRDYALVFINGEKVGELNRMSNTYEMEVDIPEDGYLELLVENMGRINYGAQITENLKGIISPVILNKKELTGQWEMYGLPMDQAPSQTDMNETVIKSRPILYSGKFDLNKSGDVFLDMHDWGKGIVFVNGHNLGRYWNIGPQQTLYLPGCWLKEEQNEVVIFEQLNNIPQKILKSTTTAVLDELKLEPAMKAHR